VSTTSVPGAHKAESATAAIGVHERGHAALTKATLGLVESVVIFNRMDETGALEPQHFEAL